MSEILVNYKITIYAIDESIRIIDNCVERIDGNTLFPKMIEQLIEKEQIEYMQIYVEDLMTNTWDKKIGSKLSNYCNGDDYHYKWLNYKIEDIQVFFNLFNQKINIVIDGPGIGRNCGEEEGINFIINNHEKDRHEFSPHVNCIYGDEKMVINLKNLEVMKKSKTFKNPKKTKIAEKWVKANRNDLINCYNELNDIDSTNIFYEANI